VPGILGVVDPRASVAASVTLVRAMAARLAAESARLRVDVESEPETPAVLGRVDLGLFTGPAIASSADGACRVVLHGEIADVPGGAAGILARYEADGARALGGLAGSFTLALWDARARRLVLANDRFGLRNVYWVADRDRLAFAPQVIALLADARLERRLDAEAAAAFLVLQCIPGDRTLVDGITILPPATVLVFEPGRGARLESTWHVRYRARRDRDHPRAIAGALQDAAGRLAADGRRIGLPLSGGLDSRTLLAALARRPLETVTYGQPGSDDLRLGGRLAALAGTSHHEIALVPGYIAATAATMVARTDGMHSCLNAHAAVLAEAGRWCDVILLGNGGDCLLDGLWNGAPDASPREMTVRLLPKLALGASPRLADALVAPQGPLAGASARAAATVETLLAASDGDTAADRADAFNVVHRHRRWVLQGVPAQATHVEFRHPYYDAGVVEAALAVPAELRVDRRAHVDALGLLSPALARVRRQGKPFGFSVPAWRWRVHVAAGRVRDAVRWRATRAGLNPFLARARRSSFADYDTELRRGSRPLLDDVVLTPATLDRGWFRPDAVRRLVREHLAGRANHAAALGVLLTLELFAREHLAPAREAPAPRLVRSA